MEDDLDFKVVARCFYLFTTKLDFTLELPSNVRLIDVVSQIRSREIMSLSAVIDLIKPSQVVADISIFETSYKLAQYYPELLENEFECSGDLQLSFNASELRLIALKYNELDEIELYDSPRLLQEWNEHPHGCIRSVASEVSDRLKNVLVLHDFYHHPLQLMFVANFLLATSNVYMPFIHDVLGLNQEYLDSSIVQAMQDCLADYVDKTIGNKKFSIIAQGVSCAFAIALQKLFVGCCGIVLLNPVCEFEQESYSGTAETKDQRFVPSKEDYYSFNSVEDAVETCSTTTTHYAAGNDEIPLVSNPKKRKTRYRISGTTNHSYSYVVANRRLSLQPTLQEEQVETLRKWSSSTVSLVRINRSAETSLSEMDNLVLSQDEFPQLFELYNKAVLASYDTPSLCLLNAFLGGTVGESLASVKIGQSNSSFARDIERNFFSVLAALYVFSPFVAMAGYRLFAESIDKRYKALARRLFWLFQSQKCSIDETPKTYINNILFLQGSHDCLVSPQTLSFYRVSGRKSARTLLGCGHDAISCCLPQLESLI